MTVETVFTLACVTASGLTIGILLWQRKSFGAYTERIERSDTLTRQSNELTRQSNARTLDEIRANTDILTQAHERNLTVFTEAQRLLKEANHSRSA